MRQDREDPKVGEVWEDPAAEYYIDGNHVLQKVVISQIEPDGRVNTVHYLDMIGCQHELPIPVFKRSYYRIA